MEFIMKTIPIFFSFNNDYVVPACVAFYSLLNKAKKDIFYEMYILHSDITENNQTLLQNIVSRFNNGKLNFINTNGFLSDFWEQGSFEGHNKKNQFTCDTIVRCFGAKFFPQYDKIIYSDVDVVIMDDVSELIDLDLDDCYIAGVKGVFNKYLSNELSHLKQEHYDMLKDTYIAGGIWVMNLKKIREDNLEEKMINIIKDDTIIKRWNDQDIINFVCYGSILCISNKFNVIVDYLNDPSNISEKLNINYLKETVKPIIMHYAGKTKPWYCPTERWSLFWWDIVNTFNIRTKILFKIYMNHLIRRKK